MAARRTFDVFKQRRLERMRLGQTVCEIVNLLSDPEIRMALVPLTDGEYENSLLEAALVDTQDNSHGIMARSHVERRVAIMYAAREPDDLSQRFFQSFEEVRELELFDVNHIWDWYMEMMNQTSPSIDGLSNDDFEQLKKVWQTIHWNELSGRVWYAAKRFLSALGNEQRQVNSPGFSSTSDSTTKSEEEESTLNAEPSSTS